MVNVLAFYSDDTSLNPAGLNVFCEMQCEKNENEQREAVHGQTIIVFDRK